jgi:peroxiredoxin
MKILLIIFPLLISITLFGQDAMYDICPIKNSEKIPSAIVYSTDGKEVNLKTFIDQKPAIIVFYRGAWCPYCTRHLSALQEIKPQIDSLGFELIAITPDDFSKLDSSVARVENLDFKLLSDKNINAINAFGIGWKINDELYRKYKDSYGMDTEWWTGAAHHVLPVPAIFIVKDGEIQYQHVDPKYSKRLDPSVLLSLLKAVK